MPSRVVLVKMNDLVQWFQTDTTSFDSFSSLYFTPFETFLFFSQLEFVFFISVKVNILHNAIVLSPADKEFMLSWLVNVEQ